jgi:hypothetical protein
MISTILYSTLADDIDFVCVWRKHGFVSPRNSVLKRYESNQIHDYIYPKPVYVFSNFVFFHFEKKVRSFAVVRTRISNYWALINFDTWDRKYRKLNYCLRRLNRQDQECSMYCIWLAIVIASLHSLKVVLFTVRLQKLNEIPQTDHTIRKTLSINKWPRS